MRWRRAAIYGLADLNLETECDGVSTFRKAQKYTLAMPSQSSTLSPPNSATARMPLPKGGQTFQRATQVHPVGLYANQGWPRDRLDKPANTLQNRAFVYLSIRPSRHGPAVLLPHRPENLSRGADVSDR